MPLMQELVDIGSMLARQMANGRMYLEATSYTIRSPVFLNLCEKRGVAHAANGGIGHRFFLFRRESP
jgi:hypothetical protein